MKDIDLRPFPGYLRDQLARLASRDVAAIEIALESLSAGSRELLVAGQYYEEDDEGNVRVNPRTRDLIRAAHEGYRSDRAAPTELELAELEARLLASPNETAGPSTVLEQIPLLKSLSDAEREELLRHVNEMHVQSGAVLIEQDAPGDALFLIVAGEASVTRGGTTIAKLGAGDAIGELSLLEGEPRSATVTMQSDGTVLAMSRDDFEALEDSPSFSRKALMTFVHEV